MEDSLRIEDYANQLTQLCAICRKRKKCDGTKICTLKKLCFNYAKTKHKRKLKEGTL